MTEPTLEYIAQHERILTELANIRSELRAIRAHTDSIPVLGRAIETLRRETRLLKAVLVWPFIRRKPK
jgi:hypothetical protein